MSHGMASSPPGSSARSSPASGSRGSEAPVRWRFGAFELDPLASRLTRGGEPVPIQAQPFKLLTLLVCEAAVAPGRVVSREHIRDHLWCETHVDYDQGINFAVRQVRQALGDDASSPRFVETVPGEGYRFLGDPEGIPRQAGEPTGSVGDAGVAGESWRFGRVAISGVLALVVAAVSLVALFVWQTKGGAQGGGFSPASSGIVPGSGGLERPRILVLPFRRLEPGAPVAGDPQLGELLAEEVITGLGRQLQGELDPLAIETVRRLGETELGIADLQPDYLIEGSIRHSPDGLRVTVRLTDAEDLSQLWSTTYRRSGPADLPELGRTVAEAVGLHFTGMRRGTAPRSRKAREPRVFELYARARDKLKDHLLIYNPEAEAEVYEAHRLLEEALELDPTYPPLHVELARIHVWRWREGYGVAPASPVSATGSGDPWIPDEGRARHHVRTALALDEQSEAAHVLHGALALFRDLDPEAARGSFERALELNPSLASAHDLLGAVLTVTGRHEEALEEMYRSLALSPLDLHLHVTVGRKLFVLRRFDEARRVFERSEELLAVPLECLTCLRLSVRMEVAEGDFDGAVELAARELGRMRELGETAPRLDAPRPEENLARYWSWRLERLPAGEFFVDRAGLWTALGEPERAFDALERALNNRREPTRVYIPWDPRFDGLRDDPRFAGIVADLFDGMVPPEISPVRVARR